MLVILYSAFGDLALALAALQAIGRHHKDSRLVFLTRDNLWQAIQPFGLFDEAILDSHERLFFRNHQGATKILRQIESHKFATIYDLHNNHRSRSQILLLRLRRILKLRPFGFAKVYSFPRTRLPLYRPVRGKAWNRHMTQALHQWLGTTGVPCDKPPDLSALTPHLASSLPKEAQALTQPFALLVAGGSLARKTSSNLWPPQKIKIWPSRHYAEIAERLSKRGIVSVLIGTEQDRPFIEPILARVPESLDLLGKTDLLALVALGQQATVVIANDNGPAHWLSLAGAPTVSLFGARPPAEVWSPIGDKVQVLTSPILADLTPDRVWQAVESILNEKKL